MAEVPAQPQSQPTKQGINWKNILIGAIIGTVLVGIIGALVFYLYQSSSEETTPTTTPKTSTPSAETSTPSAKKEEAYCPKGNVYNYDDYNFKICLPKEFKYDEYSPEKKWLIFSDETVTLGSELKSGDIVIELSDKSAAKILSSEEWVKRESSKEILIDGIKATQQRGDVCSYGPCDVSNPPISKKAITVFSKNTFTYRIYMLYKDTQESDKAAYNQLVSTFRFLD